MSTVATYFPVLQIASTQIFFRTKLGHLAEVTAFYGVFYSMHSWVVEEEEGVLEVNLHSVYQALMCVRTTGSPVRMQILNQWSRGQGSEPGFLNKLWGGLDAARL